MARGGRRAGTPGAPYPNRKDLQQTPRAATGQQYGQAQEQIQAQQVVPLPQAPPPGALPQGVPGGGTLPPVGPPPGAVPGALAFDRPTERPDQPVTAGLPFGDGPGPEMLGQTMATPDQIDVQAWRPYLGALEYMASQPNSTVTTRNFVRRLRSAMPQ